MKNVRPLLLALLATSFVAAGCGDDEKDSTSASTPAATTQTTETATTETATTDTTATEPTDTGATTTDAPANVDAAVKAAVESCKSSIDAQPTLDDSLKSDLKEVCDKAASGDAAAVTAATKEVCTKIIEANVPEGAAREQALAACK